ncbi:MAG TPA: hypothetical protein VKB54_06380 [Solirubrobacteraceae bacterium]|nr:hypothetical protein [Solirubrobacteraceae bacterium]
MVDSSRLHRPPDAWPLIICGPIVRRVTTTSVAVFFATSKPVTMATLTVYDGVDADRLPLTPQTPGARKTTPLGTKLHVCVVQATGLALAPGRLYGYDLQLQTGSGTTNLAGTGLLSEPVPLGYLPEHLPGFVLPGPLDTLRIIHMSCRRPHGCEVANLTDPDVMPLVDRLIEERREDAWTRPQQVLLTGDQLYADDVPAALLAALTSAGQALFGWTEHLPDIAGGAITDPDALAPGARSVLLNAQGVKDRPATADPAAWTDYAANHALFLSEWCAMYLFAWSPELWQLASEVPGAAHGENDFFYFLPPAAEVWTASPDTTTPTLHYAQHVAFVRRALANVATYMIFDDHDVTDNWFLNAKVDGQLRGTPLGRRLMRNALIAYAVFQHWGNVPEVFDNPNTAGGRLHSFIDATSGTPVIGRENQEDAADEVLDIGLNPVGTDRANVRMRWDYELLFDEFRLIVLDTRTWRSFPAGPRPMTEVEVHDAAGQETPVTVDWGPDGLDAVGEAWRDAAPDVPHPVAGFLEAGADLLASLAALARIGDAHAGPYEPAARAALDAGVALMEVVANAPGTAAQPSADAWFADAGEAIGSPDYRPDGDLVESVLRVATALNHAVFILREGQSAALAELGGDAPDDEMLAYLIAVERVAEVLEHSAAFLQGSVHSRARAAQHSCDLASAWGMLAYDSADPLWGSDDADLALDAMYAASEVARPSQADLEDAAARFNAARDLVWAAVNDPDRRRNAELISAEALEFQVNDRVRDTESGRPLTLVLSAAPVIGHLGFELIQRVQIQTDPTGLGEENWGNEPWSGNQPARDRLLDALTPLGSVVLLSGDVHFAYSYVVDYAGSNGQPARFLQLTSSSVKNAEALTKVLAFVEEQHSRGRDTSTTPLDFLENLPSQEEWDRYSTEVQHRLLSRETVLDSLGRQAQAAADSGADPAGSWLSDTFDIPSLKDALEATGDTGWDALVEDSGARTATQLGGVADGWEDPDGASVPDRVDPGVLNEEYVLDLVEEVGLNPWGLPRLVRTALRDTRDEVRAADSPGLEARLERRSDRAAVVRAERGTVGHTNIGVVTTRPTAHGRYVAHELHWFPIDGPVRQIQPSAFNASFRDDWIITRHCGGLQRRSPPDGALVGVCGAGPPPTPEVRLRIDITSPGQTESGRSRVHAITEAAPSMPDILVEVRGVGMTAAADAALGREVRLECTYAEGNRNDAVHLPGPTDADWLALEPGRTTWRPSFPDFCGGELRAFARADFGGVPISGDTGPGSHVIYGRNPAKADIRAQADAGTNVEVVFHRESSFTQFAASPTALGPYIGVPAPVLRSPSNSFGAGQLDDPPPTVRELWQWRANVDGAVARLNDFRADALTYQRQVQQGLSWDAATGRLEPAPPDEGVPHPEATAFTADQLDLEMWARYNSGRRYHDWNAATHAWVRQPSDSKGVTEYAPALLAMRRRVDAGNLPSDW